MNQDELMRLGMRIRAAKVKTALIIGFDNGDIISWLDDQIEGGYIISIGQKVPKIWLKDLDARMKNVFTFIDADSNTLSAVESVGHILYGTIYQKDGITKTMPGYGKPIGLLFIGGRCDSLGPLRDYVNFEPFVCPGGLIGWNTLNYPNVGALYAEVVRETGWKHEEICSETNHEIIKNGIGLLTKGV